MLFGTLKYAHQFLHIKRLHINPSKLIVKKYVLFISSAAIKITRIQNYIIFNIYILKRMIYMNMLLRRILF